MSQNIWAWELQITERKVNKLKNERKFNLFNEVLNDVSETHTDSYENNVWNTFRKKYQTFILNKVLHGPPTQIDEFQTNIFSWSNDTVIQSQWFLGSWDTEIWYKTSFHFINLTWPPQPQKEKIKKNWSDQGVRPPTPPRTPRISGLKSQILKPTFLS